MTRIRARCPACGDVEFSIHQIVVQVLSPSTGAYRFACPACGNHVNRTAVADVIELLASAGVRQDRYDHPPLTAEEQQFTEHDIAEFRTLLTSPGWFDRLQGELHED